ncbi:MAG: zf-HC2 domain-containing protein [Deltaproteobacteria bacterium]|nr:zf-HC2 domain-containing protein [Deltaproteobacteria bacterium]
MDCKEVRRLITLYVDGELDVIESRHVVEHVARCETCYFAVKSERLVKRLLKKSITYVEPPLSLISSINELYEEKRSFLPIIMRFVPTIILVLAICLALIYKINEQRFDNKIFRNIKNPPLTASISDVNKFFSIFKNNSERLFIDRNNSPNIRFVGLRYNKLEDRDAAHIFYNHKGRYISVFAISGSINDKIYLTPLRPFKGDSYIIKRDGKSLLILSNQDISYAVTGDADENELYEILSSLR